MRRKVLYSVPEDHKFYLDQDFMTGYIGKEPAWSDLARVAFVRTYARELRGDELIDHLVRDTGIDRVLAKREARKRKVVREEFWQTARRCVEFAMTEFKHVAVGGHRGWNEAKGQVRAQEMFRRLWAGKWLPPGRGLQFAGTPVVEKKGAAVINNCFAGTERFITSDGVRSFAECVGEQVDVLVDNGWATATVSSYGWQSVQRITFVPVRRSNKGGKSNLRREVIATPDHRWLLVDDSETTKLRVGDMVRSNCSRTIPNKQDYEDGYRHGLIFGDGTAGHIYLNRPGREYHIRLCGKKAAAVQYFDRVSYPKTYNGDPLASVASTADLKAFPQDASPSYVAGFMDGWTFTDGSKNKTSGSIRLSSQNSQAYAWLCENAALGGYLVVGHSVESNTATNFGPRTAPLSVTMLTQADDICWKVAAIEQLPEKEEVYCATVPLFGAFTLSSGIYTGNCGMKSTANIDKDFADPFCTIMDFLMLGVGMGSDVRGAGKVIIQDPNASYDPDWTFVVPDTREGWVEALRHVLNSYAGIKSPKNYDFSQIRPAGVPLKTFGGTSSGSAPLEKLLTAVDGTLLALVGQPITVTAIADIINHIGVCVVAGNIRRSAEILLGDASDQEFIKLKDPSKLRELSEQLKNPDLTIEERERLQAKIASHPLYTHRWASNNSLICKTTQEFADIVPSIQANGEPGIIFMDNIHAYGRMADKPDYKDAKVVGCNPCSEQCLEDGELCCLGELNPNAHDSLEDFLETIKYAYMYCKAVTMVPTNNPETNRIIAKNRRIGLSMMGIWKMYERLGMQECIRWWSEGYKEVRKWDVTYSEWLGCNQSIKVTSVKPGGTVPLLLSEEGGMKAPTAKFYFRTVRIEKNSPIVKACKAAGYRVEKDLTSDNTSVVYFPCHDPTEMRTSSEVSIWEQMELLANLQAYWSDNMVSNTITFRPEEADQIGPALRAFAHRIKSVSFLPLVTHGYEQAPYIPITEEDYVDARSNLATLDLSKATHEVDEKYCTGEICTIAR